MKISLIQFGHNQDLPQAVRDSMDDEALTTFRDSLNSHLRDGRTEMHAYIKAYRSLEESGYERHEGRWVRKSAPAADDAPWHVEPWIAVDFDGTLATHEHGDKLGTPVPAMVARVKAWMADGKTVKIFTARVADDPDGKHKAAIEAWVKQHVGQALEVTCEKDPGMTELWDDKAVGVVRNEGVKKLYLPPVEVHRAALAAQESGVAAVDGITAPLAAGEGIGEAEVRKIDAYFAEHSTDSEVEAWGGRHAERWALRVLRKIAGPVKDQPHRPSASEPGGSRQTSPDDANLGGQDHNNAFELLGRIVKVDAAQHLVFGWASIVEVNGKPVVDTQGDVITPEQIEQTAYEFVLVARAADTMHAEKKIGELVESVVFTREKAAAIVQSLAAQNIPATLDLGCVGWFIGFRVTDPEVWRDIVSGSLASFSIGGTGRREKIDVGAPA